MITNTIRKIKGDNKAHIYVESKVLTENNRKFQYDRQSCKNERIRYMY